MKMRPTSGQPSAGANEGWAVITTLMGGFAVWGGIGWLLDRWLGTSFLVAIGLIIGMGLGIYAVVARFGPPPSNPADKPAIPRTATTGASAPSSTTTQGQPPASTRRETECP